jgi:hypothetical protein
MAVNSSFVHFDHIFQIIASQVLIQILIFIFGSQSKIQILFNSINFCFCIKAVIHALYEIFSTVFQKTHHKAIIASHSYLFINHLSFRITSDILVKYFFKKEINFSGENFSLIVVNHSISEKKIANLFFSQSKLIAQAQESISSAISFDTYSERAVFNLFLSLFSIIYFTIFDKTAESRIDKISSKGKFETSLRFFKTAKYAKIIQIIAILLIIKNFHHLLRFKNIAKIVTKKISNNSNSLSKYFEKFFVNTVFKK